MLQRASSTPGAQKELVNQSQLRMRTSLSYESFRKLRWSSSTLSWSCPYSTPQQVVTTSHQDCWGELVLTHDYPLLLQDNFNFVRLNCRSKITPSTSCDGITFLLNGTNIRETPLNVSDCTKGSISIKLSQDSEGEFACSYNSILLSNNVTLAGELD